MRAENHHAFFRQRAMARHDLGPAFLTFAMPDHLATLHHQGATGTLWCLASSSTGGGTASLAGDREGIGWLQNGEQRMVFGQLPQGATRVTITPQAGGVNPPATADGVFVTVAPLTQAVTLIFSDEAGQIVAEHHLPAWVPPTQRIGDRLYRWLQDRGLLPAPKHRVSYGAGASTSAERRRRP